MQKNKTQQAPDKSLNKELQNLVIEKKIAEAVDLLYKNQSENWSLLKEGLENLKQVEINKFHFEGYEILVQFNPGRINSTIANTSSEAIKKRECFLCAEHLPKEQKSIIYDDKFAILCNPYPIFTEHLTISNIDHKPQRIKTSFPFLLQLSKSIFQNLHLFIMVPNRVLLLLIIFISRHAEKMCCL